MKPRGIDFGFRREYARCIIGKEACVMATPAKPKPSGADPVKVDPKHYSVEFENDKVRVLRIKYGPGEKSVMHWHPAMVGVFLTDGKVRFAYPNGKVEEIKTQAGQVIYFDALENLVGKPLEVIGAELK